jgi:hypothetical protein
VTICHGLRLQSYNWLLQVEIEYFRTQECGPLSLNIHT